MGLGGSNSGVVARYKGGARPLLMMNNFLEMQNPWRDVF
jgi:hypothetical protein